MFEKSALLMICCDISTKSFENVHLTCENSTKANKKNCNGVIKTNLINLQFSVNKKYPNVCIFIWLFFDFSISYLK